MGNNSEKAGLFKKITNPRQGNGVAEMKESVIKNIYIEFKEKKQFTLPAHLLPAQQGFNLLCWLQELLLYYEKIDQIVRPFDELPPLRLSSQEGLGLTAQDIHRFIINDLNLIPPQTRRRILEHAASHGSADDAWRAPAAHACRAAACRLTGKPLSKIFPGASARLRKYWLLSPGFLWSVSS